MKYITTSFAFLFLLNLLSQNITKQVLFIGNSYTSANNLPEMTRVLTLSAGDTLIYEKHDPGGQTLQGHSADINVIQKINSRNWDYVVLQEQSQRPSFPDAQVNVEVFPYARILDSMIVANDSCTETMFYMTWGRKNGDAGNCQYFPPLCTYNGMDSLLYLRYMQMTEDNNAVVSPVGALWHYIRDNYPGIELYSSDESHPSLAGTYAAACSFYSSIYHKSPLLITDNYTLDPQIAEQIRNSAKIVVFDSLSKWKAYSYLPNSDFTFQVVGDSIFTNNLSTNSNQFDWYVNGEFISNNENIHIYIQNDTTTIELISSKCGKTDTVQLEYVKLYNNILEVNKSTVSVYPNPFDNELNIKSDKEIKYIEIYDLRGQKIYKSSLKSNKIENLNLTEGLFILKIYFLDNTLKYTPIINKK